MKSIILIILLCGTFYSNNYAQNVFPNSSDNQSWEVVTWNFWGGLCQTNKIKTGVELIICNSTYIEVLECDDNFSNCGLMGYYRVVGDSVMIRNTTDCNENEGLMFDFTILNTDTLMCAYNYMDSTKFWKTNEQYINYEGIIRKTLNMNFYPYPNLPIPPFPIYPMNWIEGIGSNIHPFYPFSCIGDNCEQEQQLVKVISNNQTIYLDTILTFSFPCTGWVGIKNVEELESIKIYPTIFENKIVIENKNYSNSEALIWNLIGERVLRTEIVKGSNEINLSNLSRGSYFVQIQNDEENLVKKIIKR